MKKILVAVALVAASLVPAVPASAADTVKTAVDDAKANAICYVLPLLPKCIEYWKGKADEAKANVEKAMN